jgi:hypothetical protein
MRRAYTTPPFGVIALFALSIYSLTYIIKRHKDADNSISLHPPEKVNSFDDGKDENSLRIISLCACYPTKNTKNMDLISYDAVMDISLRRLATIVPAITYTGMYRIEEQNQTSSSCEDQVELFMSQRLSEEQTREASKNTTTYLEMIYTQPCSGKWYQQRPLMEEMAGKGHTLGGSSVSGVGLHIPPKRTHFQRHILDWGEVFQSNAKERKCSDDDPNVINMYRSRKIEQHQFDGCTIIHHPTVIRWAEAIRQHRIEKGDSPHHETMVSMLTKRRTREEAEQILKSKKHFCVLITRTTMTPRYQADGLVRHALRRLLGKKYKECLGLQAWQGGNELMKKMNMTKTGPDNTYEIQDAFKFVITMANEQSEGYLVEKTIHPYLAGSVGITATPDVGKYINADTLVSCSIPEADLAKVQQYYRGSKDKPFLWMPLNTTPDMWTTEKNNIEPIVYDPYNDKEGRDEAVLEFVTKQWEEALTPCVDKIVALDKDDDAYVKKLMQPYILNEGIRSVFDGTYIATSLLYWYLVMGSPIVQGLQIEKLLATEGVLEQTEGCGVP